MWCNFVLYNAIIKFNKAEIGLHLLQVLIKNVQLFNSMSYKKIVRNSVESNCQDSFFFAES